MQERQAKGGGFSGSRSGLPKDISTGDAKRNQFRLDVGGVNEAELSDGSQDLFAESECLKA